MTSTFDFSLGTILCHDNVIITELDFNISDFVHNIEDHLYKQPL